MAITFFIGNGFDLGLGLKTSYEDFYHYFCDNIYSPDSSNKIYKMIKEDEKNNYKNWSDLELSLGKYSDAYGDDAESFRKDKNELQLALYDYLSNEEKKIRKIEKETIEDFKRKIKNLPNDLAYEDGADFSNFLVNYHGSLEYNFVIFNYTKMVDAFINPIKRNGLFISHQSRGVDFKDKIKNVIHIHGTLSDSPIIGVNDASQIMNNVFKENDKVTYSFIKPNQNSIIRNGNNIAVENLIKGSDYICIYGMSIGDTDKKWWEEIGEWLRNNNSHRLIVFQFTNEDVLPASERIYIMEELRDRFLGKTKLKAEDQKIVRSRIIPIFNSKIFTFDSIKVDSTNELLQNEQ